MPCQKVPIKILKKESNIFDKCIKNKCGKTYTFIKDGIEEIIMVCSETKQTFNNPYTTIVCPKNLL